MNNTQFSIIMPAFNAAATIKQSIESVRQQTFTNFELIIVDDCSSDSTRKIIEQYVQEDSRIRGIYLEKNSRVAIARNTAISAANGCYIAFLDSDDLWFPEKLEKQYDLLIRGVNVVYSNYIRFQENGSENTVIAPSSVSYEQLLMGNCIGNLTGAYNCQKLGKFYQESSGHEDYLMWLQILKTDNTAQNVNEVLARYRVGKNSLSANKFKALNWMWTMYRSKLNFGVVQSSYLFFRYVVAAILKRI